MNFVQERQELTAMALQFAPTAKPDDSLQLSRADHTGKALRLYALSRYFSGLF